MTEQTTSTPTTTSHPVFKSTTEAVQELLDANIMLMSVIDQLHTRIQNVETDLRHVHEKISKLEQSDAVKTKCLNAQADELDRIKEELA